MLPKTRKGSPLVTIERSLPSAEELVQLSWARIKRMAFTKEELTQMTPAQRVVISMAHTHELLRDKLVLHKGQGFLSLRKNGKWHHHPWEISRKDFKRLSLKDQKRAAQAGVAIVEEYSML
jgi:hypothetical protein